MNFIYYFVKIKPKKHQRYKLATKTPVTKKKKQNLTCCFK